MCNLSEGVYNDGRKEGARSASIKSAESMLEKTQMSNEEISDLLAGQVTPHEVEQLRKGFKLN